jgi:hypothetical protein
LLASATPEEGIKILQRYIEVVDLGRIDPEAWTSTYAMRLFPEVRPDRGFDFGRDSGPDDSTPGPETTNGAAPEEVNGSAGVIPGRLGSHSRPESSPGRIRTYDPPVNSRPVGGCNPCPASTSGGRPGDMYRGMYHLARN